MYIDHIACDEYGWAYMSMGTKKRNLVGYELSTGKKVKYVDDDLRDRGSSYVQRDSKGVVCGYLDSPDANSDLKKKIWILASNGTNLKREKLKKLMIMAYTLVVALGCADL